MAGPGEPPADLLERIEALERALEAAASGEDTEAAELSAAVAALEREAHDRRTAADAAGRSCVDLRPEWATAPARFSADGSSLTILGEPVMEDWEMPYMGALAAAATAQGGRVLEVGFGLGLSARAVGRAAGVTAHTIIEANSDVASAAESYAAAAPVPTEVLHGFWQDVAPELPAGYFDGVLFDAYPLTREEWRDGEVCSFFAEAARLLRPGGVLTFYYDSAKSWHDSLCRWRSEMRPLLAKAGFSCVSHSEVCCAPERHCRYFWKDRFLVPLARR
eukprot:TRINITY_DN27649_c0_g2_i1.p2 TRINITY_DN27649_c0_g2~~TRINITY_DN27649_c0_g2_i1.p2  ORF type:complete len:304 (+),score=74.32 TRINITY_DN27649_c0_g2_i1:84-914(+)